MIDGIFKKLSTVQIVVSVTSSIALIVDSIVISRFMGMTSVAAVGLVTPLMMFILAFSGVLSSGGQLGVGKKLGRGNIAGASASLSLNLALTIISSVVVIAIVFGFTEKICLLFGADPGTELLFEAKTYLRGFILGTPGIIGMLGLIPIMNIDGDKKRTSISAIAATAGDIILDIVAVIFFPGNIFAIGLASSISYMIALVILLSHFFEKNGKYVLYINFKNIPWKETGDVFRQGSPAALQKILRTLLSFTLNCILLASGGELALGSFTIISNVGNLINSVGQGLSAATLTISGVMYGERIKKNLADLYKAMLKYSILWNLIALAFTLLAANLFANIFKTSKASDLSVVATGLRIFAFDYVFYSICLCAKSFYQGIGRMKVNYVITIFEGYICIALFSWIFAARWGVYGVCMGYVVGDAVSILTILIVTIIINHAFPKKLSDFLLLPINYSLKEEDMLCAEVTSIENAVEVSQRVNEFVTEHDNNLIKNGLKLSIAVEEFCKNIIQYGFEDVKKAKLEVIVIYENGNFTLQIKDNCHKFSPVEYMKLHADSVEKEKYSGIPLVFNLAKNVEYYSVLGINKLIVEA